MGLTLPAPSEASDAPISDQTTDDVQQGTRPGGPVCQIRIGDVTGSLSLTGPLCGEGKANKTSGQFSGQLNSIRANRLIRALYIH